MKKPSASTMRRRIKELRTAVNAEHDPITRRMAYLAETVLRWATEYTVGWPSPLKEAQLNATMLREELNPTKGEYKR